MLPSEKGLQVRRGYREHVIEVEDVSSAGIHTLIPFNGVDGTNKLFAVNNEGIWDVTTYDTAPTKKVAFSTTTSDVGYGVYSHHVNAADTDVLFYADNVNGLFMYDVATNTWAAATGITGVTIADINYVTVHKNHVWLGVKDKTVAYYLPLGAQAGAVSSQQLGDKFFHGGYLAGIFSWTVDGGAGVDDIIVFVSKAGDVVVYTGSGPAEADWGMKGRWYIGEIPNTPRFGSEQGGELYLLAAYGVVSMNEILQGVDTALIQADAERPSGMSKIAALIRDDMKNTSSLRGWDVNLIPAEGGLLISTPVNDSDAQIQYYYNLAVQGWGIWRDVPMTCFTEFEDSVYFGTEDNRIMVMDTDMDGQLITPSDPNNNGDDITFSILTTYSALNAEGVYKRVKMIRPDFLALTPPSYSSQARFDFDIAEGLETAFQSAAFFPTGTWDTGTWDECVWGATEQTPYTSVRGLWGHGRYIAIATKGQAKGRTRLLGWDIIFDIGGPLV